MTSDHNIILDAIENGATDRAAILEATGLEPKCLANRLWYMSNKGIIEKTPDGWRATGKPAPKPSPSAKAPRMVPLMSRGDVADGIPVFSNPIVQTAEPAAPQAPVRSAKAPIPVPAGVARELEFAVSETGAVLFKIVAGERAGQLGEINCADTLALYRLFEAVDFVRENA